MTDRHEDVLASILQKAKAEGADAADALIYTAVSESVSVRLGEVEDLERSESHDLGLRVMMGKRQATVSTSDFSPAALTELAERAVAMAKLAPEDPYCGLADRELLASGPFPDLDLFDSEEPDSAALKERALACEEAARAISGVTNSGGASASYGNGRSWIATSTGFAGHTRGSRHGVSVSVLAGEGTGMERDYDYDSAMHLEDLRGATDVGRVAGERAVARLGATKLKSQRAPVLFDKRLSSSLLGPLASGINGGAITRGTSFLKNKMGEKILPDDITIIDDPLIRRGFGSRGFDGEGLEAKPLTVIENGVLKTWILNCSQARQLGLSPNGRARRGTGGAPSSGTTNFDLAPGQMTKEELIADTGNGLLVTDMFGPQINGNTGDYSVGCSGFMIENGKLGGPVSEITIAGNLLEMWANLTRADDFERTSSMNAPTLRVGEMTIAGA